MTCHGHTAGGWQDPPWEGFNPVSPVVLGAQQASFLAALSSPSYRAEPACLDTLPTPRPQEPAGRPGTRGGHTSSSQELRSLLRPQPLPVPCEAMKLRSRSISSDRRVCSSWEGWDGQCRGPGMPTPHPHPSGARPTWLWRSSSWPSCWQRRSVCSRSSACRVRAPISRHFCEYCSDSTCSSRFSASTSDLPRAEEGKDGPGSLALCQAGSGHIDSKQLRAPGSRPSFAFSQLWGCELVTASLGCRRLLYEGMGWRSPSLKPP